MLKRITEALLFLYIFSIPIMKVPRLPIFEQKLQYSEIFFLLLIFIFFIGLLKNDVVLIKTKDLIINYIILLISGFYILITVSSSGYQLRSIIEFCGIFYLFISYFLFTQIIRDKNLWLRIIYFWCFLVVIVLLIGFIEYFSFSEFVSTHISKYSLLKNVSPFLVDRMQSTFRHPNMLASYLHISLIFLGTALVNKNNNKSLNFLLAFLAFFIIFASFLTKSRIFAGTLLTLYLFLARFKNKFLYLFRIFVLVFLVIALAFAVFSVIWYVFPVKVNFNKGKIPDIAFNVEYFPYYFYQKASIDMIRKHPFFGVGIGMFNKNLINYINLEGAEHSFQMFHPDYAFGQDPHSMQVKSRGVDPHSTYLGWAAEIGLIGVGFIILFLLSLILQVINLYKKTHGEDKLICWIFIAGLIGFLVNGLYIDILTFRHFWFFLVIISSFVNLQNKNILKYENTIS